MFHDIVWVLDTRFSAQTKFTFTLLMRFNIGADMVFCAALNAQPLS